MKKVYKKPMAYIENFEMSQHIALCDNKIVMNQATSSVCDATVDRPDNGSIFLPGSKIFTTDAGCSTTYDQFCYGAEICDMGTLLFNS